MAGNGVDAMVRRGRVVPWCAAVAAAVTAGALALPAAVHAGGPVTAPSPAAGSASAPCRPGGVTAADRTIAKQVRAAMTGRRLGQAVGGRHISCARAIVSHVKASGLGERAAVIAVATAIAESTLTNHAVATDHDSLGLFQQRPSMGWGTPAQLVSPGYATYAFLRAMLRKHPAGDWTSGDIGRIAQRVQGSAHPGAYAPEVHDAHVIVMALWPRTAGTAAGKKPKVKPAPPAARKPTGPYQRVLKEGATGFRPADSRHEAFTADWNGDRFADLVMVQRTGTVTGHTEVRVMSGANFQHLLLDTATVLGPTDLRHEFSFADWNGDGRPDLVVMLKSGTASGRTELRILDGASSFQRFLLETVTVLDPTDERHVFSLADWNDDRRLDLVMVQKAGSTSAKTEVRILDGASDFQAQLVQTDTALDTTDDRHEMAIADGNGDRRPDLVVVQKSGTPGGKVELQVLDGASIFQRFALRTSTAQGPMDDRYDLAVTDWNSDGSLELLSLHRSGTGSGRPEVRILGR